MGANYPVSGLSYLQDEQDNAHINQGEKQKARKPNKTQESCRVGLNQPLITSAQLLILSGVRQDSSVW